MPLIKLLRLTLVYDLVFFFFQAEDGIRDGTVTGVQTCALPISGADDDERRLFLGLLGDGHRDRRGFVGVGVLGPADREGSAALAAYHGLAEAAGDRKSVV